MAIPGSRRCAEAIRCDGPQPPQPFAAASSSVFLQEGLWQIRGEHAGENRQVTSKDCGRYAMADSASSCASVPARSWDVRLRTATSRLRNISGRGRPFYEDRVESRRIPTPPQIRRREPVIYAPHTALPPTSADGAHDQGEWSPIGYTARSRSILRRAGRSCPAKDVAILVHEVVLVRGEVVALPRSPCSRSNRRRDNPQHRPVRGSLPRGRRQSRDAPCSRTRRPGPAKC